METIAELARRVEAHESLARRRARRHHPDHPTTRGQTMLPVTTALQAILDQYDRIQADPEITVRTAKGIGLRFAETVLDDILRAADTMEASPYYGRDTVLSNVYREGWQSAWRHARLASIITGKDLLTSSTAADSLCRGTFATWLYLSDCIPRDEARIVEALRFSVYWQGYRDAAERIEARRTEQVRERLHSYTTYQPEETR